MDGFDFKMVYAKQRLYHGEKVIGVIGLGYVGLPLAHHFAEKYKVIGYDKSERRINELTEGIDRTRELSAEELANTHIQFVHDPAQLKAANFFIVTVPTPINHAKQPDLTMLLDATRIVAQALDQGDYVVYESTVYPGATEEKCVPLLEEISGLKMGAGFKVGFSPERINPSDKEHTFKTITKVVSGNDEEALNTIAGVYDSVIDADVFKTSSIKVAEASKVIENTQRDINIAFMNELSMIFERLGINTNEVLEAAATKWNFLNFTPGLVGGHCIGVDPYYLTHKAQAVGYHPEVVLAGRRINDNMGIHVAQQVIYHMVKKKISPAAAQVNLLGLTFKEDCPDIRNSRVKDLYQHLVDCGVHVNIFDPEAYQDEVEMVYKVSPMAFADLPAAEVNVVAVPHTFFKNLDDSEWNRISKSPGLFVDIKGAIRRHSPQAGIGRWQL
ncbi:MAG: nucleotide sugar dehydrogenase [Bdellovibrionales bacterium]